MKRNQCGTAALEIFGALGISTLMLMGLTRMIDASLDEAE